jgi:hypothetical protein
MEKHVKVLLEQIAENLEQIKIDQEAARKPKEDPILKVIEQRLQAVESYNPIVNSNLAKIGSALKELSETIKSFEPVNKTKVEHVFFPGLLAWFDNLKRWKFVFFFMLVSGILLSINIYLNNSINRYEDGYYKYKMGFYSNYDKAYIDSAYKNDEKRIIILIDSLDAKMEEQERKKQEMLESKRKADQLERELKESE